MVLGFSTNFFKVYRFYIAGVAILLMAFILALQSPYISQKIQSHAISSTEDMFGSRSLTQEQECKIRMLAQKLGINQSIAIRKMNAQALQLLGYHNAFAYFPRAFNIIPLGNTAFVYISEGFFEDLNPDEQDFLIGHELVHIKEEHTKYIPVIYLALFILITRGVWLMRKKYAFFRYWIVTIGLWIALIWMINVGQLYYRRHIEREADIQSLEYLGTHTGLLKIIERWIREFKTPIHNNYYGLFADHPSVAERKAYCLELQQNHKRS
ncbi:hypothetical protein BH09DEP1_BH09DEP1_0230 [soil metagenome]